MDRFQLIDFSLTRESDTKLLLLVSGKDLYKNVLNRAFPALRFSRTFQDRFARFDWGTYINGVDEPSETALRDFCGLLKRAVFIHDDLDESFAVSFHKQTPTERTPMGQLVREAKPYDRAGSPGSIEKARTLAAHLADFVRQHPTYRGAEVVAAVPASNPDKAFDLPEVLAAEIGRLTGLAEGTTGVHKARPTRPMKQCRTYREKVDNLADAFTADPAVFHGKRVIVVDDVYETGFSMNEVGRTIRGAGATLVLGLAATKTTFDLAQGSDRKGPDDDLAY
jgi:predicted amidophosphoribosyltransferase